MEKIMSSMDDGGSVYQPQAHRWDTYPHTSKAHLIAKPQFQEEAIKGFKGTGIKVTTEGHEILGSTIGATSFAEEYTSLKVKDC